VHSLVLSKADWDPDGHEEGSQRFVGGGERSRRSSGGKAGAKRSSQGSVGSIGSSGSRRSSSSKSSSKSGRKSKSRKSSKGGGSPSPNKSAKVLSPGLPLPEAATVGAVGGFEGNLREQRDANVHSSMAKVTVDVGRI
jgi:hypothetical protein